MDAMLKKSGLLLEEEFFMKKDAILLAKLRELQQMEQTRKTLSEVSGIKN